MRPLIEFSFETILARSNNIFEIMTMEAIDVLLKVIQGDHMVFQQSRLSSHPGFKDVGPHCNHANDSLGTKCNEVCQYLTQNQSSRMAEVEVARAAMMRASTMRRI